LTTILSKIGSGGDHLKAEAFVRRVATQRLTGGDDHKFDSAGAHQWAERFGNTIKLEYLVHMPKPVWEPAFRNLAIAFRHSNEQYPHGASNQH
jgi:hypothetical protein